MNETDLSSHKLPPQNLEAEQSVLGGILIENYAINKVMEVLQPHDFYRESPHKIYKSLIDLSERDEPADLITLTNELKNNGHLDSLGGASYLASLIDSVPTAANIEYYAKIVKEKSILRKLIQTSTEIITQSYEDRGDVEGFLDEAERAIFDISENRVRPSFYPIRDIVKESFKILERLYEKEQLGIRMLCSEAHVEGTRLRSGFLSESDWPRLTIAAGNLSDASIYIDDSAALSILELRAKARRLKIEHGGLGMLIVDYLKLMKGRKRVTVGQQ